MKCDKTYCDREASVFEICTEEGLVCKWCDHCAEVIRRALEMVPEWKPIYEVISKEEYILLSVMAA